MTRPQLVDGIHHTEHAMLLVRGGQVLASAVVNAFGWHINLGRPNRGGRARCRWQSVPTRAEAQDLLHRIVMVV